MGEFTEILFWLAVFVAIAVRNVAASRQKAAAAGRDDPAEVARERALARAREHEATKSRAQEHEALRAGREGRAPDRREGTRPARPARAPHRRVEQAGEARRSDPSQRARHRALAERPPGRPDVGRKKQGGLLGRFADLAEEIERQVEAQRAAAREQGLSAAQAESTVLVPGREVLPAAEPLRAARRTARLPAPPVSPGRRSSGPAGGGLGRLESYDPLRRAIVLSEILGRPGGLSEDSILERWD